MEEAHGGVVTVRLAQRACDPVAGDDLAVVIALADRCAALSRVRQPHNTHAERWAAAPVVRADHDHYASVAARGLPLIGDALVIADAVAEAAGDGGGRSRP